MMATAADVRGPGRGVPTKAAIAAWNLAHPDDLYEAGPPREVNGSAPDYPDDDFEVLFDESAADGAPPDTGETKPRRPRSKTAKPGIKNLFGRAKPKTSGTKRKRVSTEDLLSSVWRGAAKLAMPLPPLHRTLRVQAPVAGILLEDAVKDTVADTILQPFARIAETGKTVSALLGPPIIVTGLTLHMQQRAEQGLPPSSIVMSMGTEALRNSLMTWMEVAGPRFEQAMAREREFEDKYGADVDEFIKWLFSAPPATAAEAEAEEDMYRKATGARAA